MPKQRQDLTGKQIDQITVIKYSHSDPKHCFWECKCTCGKTIIKRTADLTKKNTKRMSCGCKYKGTKDLSGQIFGRLTVQKFHHKDKWNHSYWECLCSCGKTKIVHGNNLRKEKSQSCGCLCSEIVSEQKTTHGLSKHPIYNTWENMIDRCYNQNNISYKNYGGRGVIVCQEWLDVTNFIEDMFPSFIDGLTLERKNNNDMYKKENCKWATKKEQARNRRNNKLISYNNNTYTMVELCETFNINRYTLRERLKRGWSLEKALETPVKNQNKIN